MIVDLEVLMNDREFDSLMRSAYGRDAGGTRESPAVIGIISGVISGLSSFVALWAAGVDVDDISPYGVVIPIMTFGFGYLYYKYLEHVSIRTGPTFGENEKRHVTSELKRIGMKHDPFE